MAEMKLVGEAIPSIVARAGEAKNIHFTMSLYCSKPNSKSGDLSVTWPLDNMAYANSTTATHVIGETSIANSLHHSVRVILAGLAGYSGYVLSVYELDRRKFYNTFHEGGIRLVLVVICIISVLLVYGWICALVWWISDLGNTKVSRKMSTDESKIDLESSSRGGSATYEVQHGRVPTSELFTQGSDLAEKNGVNRVKVLTSDPNSLVDQVPADSRAINWQLFEAEAFSFEF